MNTIAGRIWWGLVVLGFIAFLFRVRSILTPFLFALLIAYILYPLVLMVERRGASRSMSIFVVYLFLASVLGVIFWLVVPRLLAELDDLLQLLPAKIKAWEELGQKTRGLFRKIELSGVLRDAAAIILERLETGAEAWANRLLKAAVSLFANVGSLVISPVLAFYLLRDHGAMRERSLQYIPALYRGHVRNIFREINTALDGFFRGQILVSLFVGLFIYLGLYLLKIPYALFIGLTAGLFDIIPYFGPVIGFLPAAAFALLKSPAAVLWVLLIFIAANQIENGLISPKIIGDRVGLHPLAVIFSVLVGGTLLGLTGMLLAVPAAAVIRVLLEYFFLRRKTAG